LARTGPGDKKSTGGQYWPITQSLAQASTGRAMYEELRAKSEVRRKYLAGKKYCLHF